MYEEKEAYLLRIFLTDKDKYKGKSLFEHLLENFKDKGIQGATVFHGIAGYGNKKMIHSAGILSVSDALPVVIEVCDDFKNIKLAINITKEFFEKANVGGFLTYEKAHVIFFKN
ncbi:MAG: hypothetical protein KatS3mg129_3004 [Leptospiraceae bacterium]|nr:MAG: hypothetical protein KatS3mg129_3004 [Leptospiraceae bacterium]